VAAEAEHAGVPRHAGTVKCNSYDNNYHHTTFARSMRVPSAFFFHLFWKVTFGDKGTGFHVPDALSVIQAAVPKH